MLAVDPGSGNLGALHIGEAECYAVIVTKIEFAKVTLKVVLAHMVIDAINPALEDREIPLDGVCVRVATNVLVN
jgi:hypothetical protein